MRGTMDSEPSTMHVLIIGGGIAGLTLANALAHAPNITFTLLESRPLLDPQVGASIGLGAQSLRIFDQFGAAQAIIDDTVACSYLRVHYPNGKLVSEPQPVFELLEPRLGYGITFLDRQKVLRAAAETLEAKIRETGRGTVLVNKRLHHIEHSPAGVTAFCEDGTTYTGSLVVGCDGVNSRVRSEMFRLADNHGSPGYFPPAERSKMTAEYMCLFGISAAVPAFARPGTIDLVYDKGRGFLVITGKDHRVYWFYFEKMPKVYTYTEPDFPRFTTADAERCAAGIVEKVVLEDGTKFAALWEKRVSFTLVPMEEALFDKWYWGRVAVLGDAVHKMTANHGQAGNNAIESAAALANELVRLAGRQKQQQQQQEGKMTDELEFSTQDFHAAFTSWQATRQCRIEATVKEAAMVCRYDCLDSPMAYVFNYWLLPNFPTLFIDMQSRNMIGAELLEWLPVPERSLKGSMAFNQNMGTGKGESYLGRMMRGLPLLGVAWWMWGARREMGEQWNEEWEGMLRMMADPIGVEKERVAEVVMFVVCEMMIYALRGLESGRRANRLNLFLRYPIWVPLLGHFYGLGITMPIYFFFQYLASSIDNFAPGDMRLMNVAYITSISSSLLLAGAFALAPILRQSSTNLDLSTLKVISLLAPVGISLFQYLVTRVHKDTENHDMVHNCTADLPVIRRTIHIMLALGGIVLSCQVLYLPLSPATAASSPTTSALHSTHLALSLSGTLWLALHFFDLCRAGMSSVPQTLFAFLSLATLHFFAPAHLRPIIDASFLLLGWLMREEILASKKEWRAVTREKYGGGKSVWEVEGMGQSVVREKGMGYGDVVMTGQEGNGMLKGLVDGHLKYANGVPRSSGLAGEGMGPKF